MGKKVNKTYQALREGAALGLANDALDRFVFERYHKANSKRIVKAALMALTDPHLTHEAALHAIYALAIRHRLHPAKPGKPERTQPATPPIAPDILDATADA